jgi:hypothetical protein
MIKLKIFLLFLSISVSSFAQMVQVIERDMDYISPGEMTQFQYISKNSDVSNIPKIASLKATCNNTADETVVHLFNLLWQTANNFGANSFKIDSIENKSKNYISLTLSIYNLTSEQLEINSGLFPQNIVYVFGDFDKKIQSNKSIKFNNEKIELPPMEYVSYQNKVGAEAIVSIGVITGAKVWIVGKEGRLPMHLSVNGFSVGPGSFSSNQIGIGFNTGRIYPIDFDFGQFLVDVLKENRKINYTSIPPTFKTDIKLERSEKQMNTNHPKGTLILFRRNNKELDQIFNFFINDSIKGGLLPYGYQELTIEISNDPIVICYKNGCVENFTIKLDPGQTKYIECSISKKDNTPKIWEVEPRNGKFFADQAKYFQDKREKENSSNK